MLRLGPFGSVFDYGLCDPEADGFFGAEWNYYTMHMFTMVEYYEGRLGNLVFCVICEGRDR